MTDPSENKDIDFERAEAVIRVLGHLCFEADKSKFLELKGLLTECRDKAQDLFVERLHSCRSQELEAE